MAFDGRPDPNKGNDEKSPCTLHFMNSSLQSFCQLYRVIIIIRIII